MDLMDEMEWRVDTPPKVYYTSYSQSPKRDRDESLEEELQLEQERVLSRRFAPAGSTLPGSGFAGFAGFARTDFQLPPIGNGVSARDFANLGRHEYLMDNDRNDLFLDFPVADQPPPFQPNTYYGYGQSTLGLPLPPLPDLNQQTQGEWWDHCAGALMTVTVLITTVTANCAKFLGDRTYKAGRFIYQNRGRATETVTETVTKFAQGASETKRRIIEFIRPKPPPPRRRSPPRIRRQPNMTTVRIQVENEERERREALEAAAIDIMGSSTGGFEPLMSGVLPSPEDFQPTMPGVIQPSSSFQPILSGTTSTSADFQFSMPGAMPEDNRPTTSIAPSVPTETDLRQSAPMGLAMLPYNDSLDSNMNDTISATIPTIATNDYLSEPWETSILDIPYSSDSETDELMSEDDDLESPITDDMDFEVELPADSGRWAAVDELQRLNAENDESGMDLTLECDEPSLPESFQPPPSAVSGLGYPICSPLSQIPFANVEQTSPSAFSDLSKSIYSQITQSAFSGFSNSIIPPLSPALPTNHEEPLSSPLSDPPSDLDMMTPPAMTPARRSPKKSVGFYESPKTGRPVNRVKKYYIGESMAHPVSSSPPEESDGSSISSTIDSDVSVYDDPVMEAAAAAYGRFNQGISTPSVAMEQPNLAFVTNDDTPVGNPDPAGNFYKKTRPITIGHTGLEIAGYAGNTPADDSLISHGSSDIGQTNSEIVGAVGSISTAASLPSNGPILATIHNNQYVPRQTRRRTGASSTIVTAQGSPIKKQSRSPPRSARSFSKLSMESLIMQENVTSPPESARRPPRAPTTTPVEFALITTGGKRLSPAEGLPVESSKEDISAGQEHTSQKQDTATEEAATPGQLANASNESTPQQDLTSQLGSLQVSDRRHSVRRRRKELEAQKLREEEEQRVAEEKARKEREEAEAAAKKARLEKEKAEEKARAAKEAEEERKRNSVREIPVEKVIQPLTADWEAKVDAAMAKQSNNVVAKTSTGTALTRKDLGTLFPQPGRDPASGWLNDEVIMAYLQAVVDYGREISGYKDGDIPKYHAFNTFFFKNIRDKGVQSVKRWAIKAKIGGKNLESVERVFIPVHSGAHWTLLVVSPIAHTIEYFDSLDRGPGPFIKVAKDWLKQEMGKNYKEDEWRVVLADGGGPQQSNSSDCGVFAVTTAKMVLLGINPEAYSSLDIPLQRKRMVAELMNGGFTADFAPNFTFGTGDLA